MLTHNNRRGTAPVLSENPMTLTYRGVAYDSQPALLTHLLDKFKKEQRLEKELKKDRERIAAGPSI